MFHVGKNMFHAEDGFLAKFYDTLDQAYNGEY